MVGSGSEPWSRSSAFSRDGGNRHQELACPRTCCSRPSRSRLPRRTRTLLARSDAAERAITLLIVGAPFVALLWAVLAFWGSGIHARDAVLAIVLFLVVGHGVTVGYHRLLAHKSFVAVRPLKLALAGAGSMAFEGGPIGWVADHRRHHVFSDLEGDPHSPHGARTPLHGLWHAHVGWLFNHEPTSWPRHAKDLMADRDMVVMNALFPMWCVVSLAIPFVAGWLLGGDAVRRVDGAAVGRRGARLPRPPRDVEHQLAVSCLRSPSVRHDRSEHERRRPRAVHDGRVVAQRPSRVPPVGPPRPAPASVGHLGSRDLLLRAARMGLRRALGDARPRTRSDADRSG